MMKIFSVCVKFFLYQRIKNNFINLLIRFQNRIQKCPFFNKIGQVGKRPFFALFWSFFWGGVKKPHFSPFPPKPNNQGTRCSTQGVLSRGAPTPVFWSFWGQKTPKMVGVSKMGVKFDP